jgi:hypothetical protein
MTNFHSKLLRIELPRASITADMAPSEFFDRAEKIADVNGWQIDRRRNYAGEGYDHLNLHLGQDPTAPMLRMVSTPESGRKINTDVVAQRHSGVPDYRQYVSMLKDTAKRFLSEYNRTHGTNIRLGLPRKPPEWDPSDVSCARLGYVRGKFDDAVETLTLGEGDVRKRLASAYLALHMVQPKDLPAPLRPHWEWVRDQLTRRPARHKMEGSLDATLSQIKNSTGAKIAERIYGIRGALHELCPDEYYWMTD